MICLKQFFLGTTQLGAAKIYLITVHEFSPWSRAWMEQFVEISLPARDSFVFAADEQSILLFLTKVVIDRLALTLRSALNTWQ